MLSLSTETWTALGAVAAIGSLGVAVAAYVRPRYRRSKSSDRSLGVGGSIGQPNSDGAGERRAPAEAARGPADLPEMHIERPQSQAPLRTVDSGHQLIGIVGRALVYEFSHETPRHAEDSELIASFLDQVKDWGEVVGELGPGESVRAGQCLGELLNELRDAGWAVRAALEDQTLVAGTKRSPWPAARIQLVRRGDSQRAA